MQRKQPDMQKTWSNDSLSSQLLSKPLVSRHHSINVDKPRKHARRTSLPVKNGSSSSGNVGLNGFESGRISSERKRFRESINAGTRRESDARRRSAPILPKPSPGLRMAGSRNGISHSSSGRVIFGVGEEGDDEDESEDAENDTFDTDGIGERTATSIEGLSAADSSIPYAAGPSSAGDRRALHDISSSDASSSERHAFDWDIPKRKASINPVLQKKGSRTFEERADQNSSPYKRSSYNSSIQREGSSPSTPTLRRRELDTTSSTLRVNQPTDGKNNGSISPTTAYANGKASSLSGNGNVSSNANKTAVGHSTKKGISKVFGSPQFTSSNAAIEAGLLVLACITVAIRVGRYPDDATGTQAWELMVLVIASSIFFVFGRRPGENCTIWATSRRQYRDCGDDGVMCGLLLGPLLAATCLFASLGDRPAVRLASGDGLPFPPWRVESPPLLLGSRAVPHPTMTALALSRCTLLSLQTAMSTSLLMHHIATMWIRRPHEISTSTLQRLWSYVKFTFAVSTIMAVLREAFAWIEFPLWTGLTRVELFITTFAFQATLYTISQLARRSFTLGELAVVACVGVTLSVETLNLTSAKLLPNSTPYIKTFRRPTPLLIFQLALVVGTFMIGFLLSPLLYLSRHLAQKPVHRLRWPHKRDLHRRLLAFFFYLFAALYVIGVLGLWVYWMLDWKNPWLWTFNFVLSGRRWWSRPALITFWISLVTLSIAGWQATVLSGKRFRIRTGGSHSSHIASASTASSPATTPHQTFSVARLGTSHNAVPAQSANEQLEGTLKGKPVSNGGELSTLSSSTSQIFPKRAAYLSLNARRKFFHALAVLLFVPGIAYDPAFTHLAFSLAFSVFIFAEYVRYYALYPFGATLHVFLSEFTDHKDSGPVILSHFYLLTGCAGGLWIEGLHGVSTRAGLNIAQHAVQKSNVQSFWSSVLGTIGWEAGNKDGAFQFGFAATDIGQWTRSESGNVDISMFIGVLTLGIGDALASIIGRRYGRVRWPKSGKTLEGTVAFVTSIYASALVLRAFGLCAPFSLVRFGVVSLILGLVEGISNQNDNLVLPIYGVIALSVLQV